MMSVGAATIMDAPGLQKISRSELSRLEGFGDNCEFGFMLRRLGFEDGMLFRWASVKPESLLATLRGDFENIYEFDNLIPAQTGMVRDLHYGTAWHTHMFSARREGKLVFESDAETRRAIHANEASKLTYLVAKLRRKFAHPNPIFVIKSNPGIAEQVLEEIHYQIYRRVASPHFMLLEIQADAARAGTVELVDRNRMRGYISRFASYESSEDADDASWVQVLSHALASNSEATDMADGIAQDSTPRGVILPFPEAAEPNLLIPVRGDIRGGIASRIGGNDWCRLVDEETYRLHALGTSATTLRWTGVQLPPSCILSVWAMCAISESKPVRATLEITCANGRALRKQHVFDKVEVQRFSISTPAHLANPLTVSLSVEALAPLQVGERAVIDLDPICAVPS